MKLVLLAWAAVLLAGCSGSDEADGTPSLPDGSQEASPPSGEREADVLDVLPSEGGSPPIDDASRAPFDAFPIPDGPVGECLGCVIDQCATQVSACFTNPTCRTGLVCTLQTCLAITPDARAQLDGGIDPACALACFNNDLLSALAAVGNITCISTHCTGACSSVVSLGD